MKYKDISAKNFELSIYDYLKTQSETYSFRAVGIITEQQFIFCSNMEKDDKVFHDQIIWGLSNIIYPNLHGDINAFILKNGDSILLTAIDNKFFISLPNNSFISQRQFDMLSYALHQIDKYNNDVEERKKVKIDILDYIPFDCRDLTVNELLDNFKNFIGDKNKSYDDVIIGKTYEEIKELKEENTPLSR